MKLVVLFAVFMASFNLYAQVNAPQLISWFAGADIVGSGDFDKGEDIKDGMTVREFEFQAASQIDQTWEGYLTLAYHNELQQNEEHLEVHEAFLYSPRIFEQANVKIGKFFLGFGRLNRFHRHDWIFTEAPMYHKAFFGNEGVKDTGAEYSKIVGGDFNWKATIGLVTGNEFRHEHNHEEGEEDEHDHGIQGEHSDGQPYAPTGYLRLSGFHEITTTEGIEAGINFITRSDEEGSRYHFAGIDFIYKDRFNQFVRNLVQAEFWSRTTYLKGEDIDGLQDGGGYIYYERGFDRHHALGARIDYFRFDEREEGEHLHVDGFHVTDPYQSATLSYTYRNSEFMRTRLAIEHSTGLEIDEEEKDVTRGFLQIVFNIGAHPAHVY